MERRAPPRPDRAAGGVLVERARASLCDVAARRGREPRSVYARRIRRALNNLLETYPAFVGLALALVISGKAGGVGAIGAEIYLAARVLYLIVYAAGVSFVRTLFWGLSIFGLIMMLVRFLG